jgi:UDP-N-acetylglucosamine 1-carboxyvinyltransferase
MSTLVIAGGKSLRGSIAVGPAKNSAVAILCASLMVRGEVLLRRVPRIQEVERILEILKSIGVRMSWQDEHTLLLDTSAPLAPDRIDKKACMQVRSSLLLLGALAAREKEYKLYKSGGCKLGERTVRPHLFALRKLGVDAESLSAYYRVKNNLHAGGRIVMYESGDTPTENAVMAAALAGGATTIAFASANYMVQDLCYFLRAAGAKIDGIGTTTLSIAGVPRLAKRVEYGIMPDPIEAMTFVSLGITTHSRLTVTNCPIDFLELELEKLSVMGQKFALLNERLSDNRAFRIVDIRLEPSALSALPDKLYGRPFPGLNIDHVPLFVPILTQAKGRSLIHDWIYENRAVYYLELAKLGAKVTLLDPHRMFVEGKTPLRGNELMCPAAIRPATAVLIAMLAAKGTSVLHGTYTIERGHEQLVERLRAIGASIEQREG